jgi:peptidoglycan-associated lipoprotein
MRKHVPAVVVVALATIVLAGLWQPASADAKRLRAFVYPDRGRPEMSVVVDDFRVNETVWDLGGVQYVWVRGPAGSFKVPLENVSQIEVLKFVGLTQIDWARFDVKVTEHNPDVVRFGTMDIRVLRGQAGDEAWYYYPATVKDRGTRFWRIVIGPDRLPPTIPWEEPKAAEEPVRVPVAMPAPAAPAAPSGESDEGLFARMSLEELNASNPLADVFFDFDKADIRPDAEETLRRNVAWLQRWESVMVRIDGYADVRGTHEYNVELGQRRAEMTRSVLLSMGIPSSRIVMASRGESEAFCTEQTEECWARNRRAHFVITAK